MSNLEIFFTLCIPILLVGLGMGMKTKTPKKNRWIGWRTPAAMKNETIFKKANIYGGKIMFRYGFVILILTSIIDIILRYESIVMGFILDQIDHHFRDRDDSPVILIVNNCY